MAKTIKGLQSEVKRVRELSRKKRVQLNRAKKLQGILRREKRHLEMLERDYRIACESDCYRDLHDLGYT